MAVAKKNFKQKSKKAFIPNDIGSKMGYIEYKMAKEAMLNYNAQSEKARKGISAQDYFRDLVNSDFGLKGYCVRVIFE